MKVFVAVEGQSRDAIVTWCAEHDLVLTHDEPWTHGAVHARWSDGSSSVTVVDDARSMAQLWCFEEPQPRLVEHAASLGLESAEVVLAGVCEAADERSLIQALYRAHALRLVEGEVDASLLELECTLLDDARPWVRWAAARLVAHRATAKVERALADAAQPHPELSAVHLRVRAQLEEAQAGTLDDEPTGAWDELLARAREGLAEGQPRRAARAMDALLADALDHTEGLLLRGRAYASLGEPLLALALFGAAEALGRQQRDKPESKDHSAVEALLAQIAEQRQALLDIEAAAPDAGSDDALVGWLERWARDGREEAACGAALAVTPRAPQLAGVLGFVTGRHRQDRRLLELAVERAPTSRWALRSLGAALQADRPDDAVAAYERALAADGAHEGEAAMIDRLAAAFASAKQPHHPAIDVMLLEDLTGLLYDERRWKDAIGYADRLVELNPKSTTAWQWRANARTFAQRHEEAVVTYHEALAALDAAFDAGDGEVGVDPRPSMRFSLAGVLAKLGQADAALSQLRRAVRADAKWAREAASDSYFEELWGSDACVAITEGEPAALVLEEERDPVFAEGLLERASVLCERGAHEAALALTTQAALLGEVLGVVGVRARALALEGRALAFSGQSERAIQRTERAAALASELDAGVRGEVARQLGVALHSARLYDRAAAAYQRSLELQREAHGERHPRVATALGDLGRLAADRGEPARDYLCDAVELLEVFVRESASATEQAGARVELAILQHSLAESFRSSHEVDAALGAMDACVTQIREAIDGVTTFTQGFLDHALSTCEALVEESGDSQRARAGELVQRLEDARIGGEPRERRERDFWFRLRRFVRTTLRQGVPEPALARMLADALRGGTEMSREVARIPEVAGLAKALAERATRYPTVLAMAVMALSAAEANGNLDGALESLQELCVAALTR